MPVVDHSRLVGNAGAYEVASLLSRICLVRPVTADTDVGIDLYCETVRKGMPFLHFWVQVKAGRKQVRLSDDRQTAKCSFDTTHINYWSRQPVPVFGALVDDPSEAKEHSGVYLVDISWYIVTHGVPDTGSVTYKSFLRLQHGDRDGLERFVYGTVEAATALWLLHMYGVVRPIPITQTEYWQRYPQLPVVRYQDRVAEQIRLTAAITIVQAFCQGCIAGIREDTRRSLGALAKAQSVNHWENPMAAAISLHCDGDFECAKECYEQARDCILRDEKTRARGEWKQRLGLIRFLIDLTEHSRPIRLPDGDPEDHPGG